MERDRQAADRLTECLKGFYTRWTIPVLTVLEEGPQHFNTLRRSISGVSAHSLSRCLRKLENDGLVKRRVEGTGAPRVEYRLTGLGNSLVPALSPLAEWVETHYDAVLQARSDGAGR